MLNENIKSIRISKGLSQEELAMRLHVVRQTISKWERGLSVPDSDMIISLAKVLETSVSVLLGEAINEGGSDMGAQRDGEMDADRLYVLAQKLEDMNLRFAKRKVMRRRLLHWSCISVCIVIVISFVCLFQLNSSYLRWGGEDAETMVMGVGFHMLEWVFVRSAPLVFIGAAVGIVLTCDKE